MSTAETAINLIDAERPWPGLLSFAEEAAKLFHGRSKEVQELVRLLNHETVSFLYGKSGLGKTSLLQAGLFPRLREADRLPVYVRLSYDATAVSPKEQVFNALIAAMDQWDVEGDRPHATDNAWAFLHRRDFEWWSPRNKPVRPVLVFDQFEELFTIGQESTEARALAAQTVDLMMELTTHRPGAEVRQAFETQPDTVENFDYDATNYQVLFAFREDFLPQFDQLRERLRINPHNRLALERLSGQTATESILGTGGRLVTPAVAEDIVRFVAGERDAAEDEKPLPLLEVEPWLLSLVCQQVNEQRLAAAIPQPHISSALLTGTRDLILAQYYASCIAGFDARVAAFLEDRLLTESGFRNTYPYDEALHVDGINAHVIDTLVDRRLLRKELHLGVQRVEISHDVLGPVLVRYRQQRMQQEADAVAAVRDISNRRRISEGRKRSGRLVVLATAVLAVLGVTLYLRDREMQRAESTARWAQEIQVSNYSLLLKAVETKPVSEEIVSELEHIVEITAALRRRYPSQLQLAAQHLQFMYLAALAADSNDVGKKQNAVLALADSLPKMTAGPVANATDLELAYQLAGLVAERSDSGAHLIAILREHVALLSNRNLSPYSETRAVVAARRLAARLDSPEEKLAVLEPAIKRLNATRLGEFAYGDEPRRFGLLASDAADAVAARGNPDPALMRRLLTVARSAYEIRLDVAKIAQRRLGTSAMQDSVVSALGGLAWMELVTGKFAESKAHSDSALAIDPTRTWIRQNQLHARLFLGEWQSMLPELARLRDGVPVQGQVRPYSVSTLDDIADFRKFGLQHPNLDRYEQFFRGDRR